LAWSGAERPWGTVRFLTVPQLRLGGPGFAQGLVSARTLIDAPEARKKFSELVATAGNGRAIDEDFVPKKIVFTILLKQGEELTVETLFPFAQVMLRQTALYLEGKAEVEVIPIRMAPGA
jgi:uncharacterized protein (TIGR04141 family)